VIDMAIENINRPGYLPEPRDTRAQQVKSSAAQEVSSVQAVDMQQDAVLNGKGAAAETNASGSTNQITEDVVNELNEAILGVRRELKFSIDDGSGRAVVQVLDSETGETIRQLPSDEVLAVSRHIREVLESSQSGGSSAEGAVGVIFQSTA
jgi:flagellar protein FlaG